MNNINLAISTERKGGTHTALPNFFNVSIVSEDDMKYHYTYRLIAENPVDERVEYIGVRSCNCDPIEDSDYMSSSRHVKAAMNNGVIFNKEIIMLHANRKDAVAHEVALHDLHHVSLNPRFFNKAKQTCVGFDTAGTSNPSQTRKISGKNVWQDEEKRRRINEAQKKAYASQEVRLNRAKAGKSSWSNPEKKAKHIAALKVALSTKEARETKTRVLKEYHALFGRYCEIHGIKKPGCGYSNVNRAEFTAWLESMND